ncbi:hypothetical protein Omen_007 [Erwinia phage Omen]|uniref:Uncharacterized protein n=1 Tax=Erwinia phage Harbringer TaxID=3158978 RepID=A0AAU8EHV3_9CAUD
MENHTISSSLKSTVKTLIISNCYLLFSIEVFFKESVKRNGEKNVHPYLLRVKVYFHGDSI